MGFHGKDDAESIQNRYDDSVRKPLYDEIARLRKRAEQAEAQVRALRDAWYAQDGDTNATILDRLARLLGIPRSQGPSEALATPPAPCPPHKPVLGGACQCGRVKWLAPAGEDT